MFRPFCWGYGLLLAALALTPFVGQAQAPADSSAPAVGKPRRELYDLGPYGTYHYDRPRLLAPIRDVPGDFVGYARALWSPRTLPVLAGVAVSTALLIPFDQATHDAVVRSADHIGLDHSSAQNVVLDSKLGMLNLAIRYPATLNSTLYWLGEGSPSLLTAGGFWLTGLVRRDNRALSTASQLCENALVTGVLTQALKRMCGRQTPRLATRDGGRWQWFPNPKVYQKHVPNYDAFPSGHLTTLSATFTTLAENYPEYRRFIYPAGGAVLAAVGYAMINTGVHWAGDYPLALALGYSYAKLAVRRHRTRLDAPVGQHRHGWGRPTICPTGTGLAVVWRPR